MCLAQASLFNLFELWSRSGEPISKRAGSTYPIAAMEQYSTENCSMRRGLWTGIALLAFGYATLPTPAFAGFGAIAWDQVSGQRGWSWNQPTAQKAGEVALSECGASGCKVVIHTVARQCAALATTQDGKAAGGAARKTKDAARLAALADCQKRGAGDCVVRVGDCNK
jgi:Domain of unknown function (DUF4189)